MKRNSRDLSLRTHYTRIHVIFHKTCYANFIKLIINIIIKENLYYKNVYAHPLSISVFSMYIFSNCYSHAMFRKWTIDFWNRSANYLCTYLDEQRLCDIIYLVINNCLNKSSLLPSSYLYIYLHPHFICLSYFFIDCNCMCNNVLCGLHMH